MNIQMLQIISAIARMSCLISAQCSIIVQPPNHERINSTTVSILSIPAPIAIPLTILKAKGGGRQTVWLEASPYCLAMAISCRITMILSSRSKSIFSSMPPILHGDGVRFAFNDVCHGFGAGTFAFPVGCGFGAASPSVGAMASGLWALAFGWEGEFGTFASH